MIDFLLENGELVVAACAVFLTVHEIRTTRAHNRLSVKPHFTTLSHQDIIDGEEWVWLELINNGLGPALITRYRVFIDGKPLTENNYQAVHDEVLAVAPKSFSLCTVRAFHSNHLFPAGENVRVLQFRMPLQTPRLGDQFVAFSRRMDVLIHYESMYGEKWIYNFRHNTTTRLP